jgi:two-component system CheB/CheR fusion protein
MPNEQRRTSSEFQRPRYLVLVGGTDEGVNAAHTLFAILPVLPAAAVIYGHSGSANAETLLSDFQARSAMEVLRAEDDLPLEPGKAYICAPGEELFYEDTRIKIRPAKQTRDNAIDHIFRASAGTDLHVIGILLAGRGADGTLGLSDIKQAGGLTIVQSPETAEPDEMPLNAIRLGHVDCVAAVEEMPEIVTAYANHHQVVCEGALESEQDQDVRLQSILELLHHKTGIDLRSHRFSVVQRRIRRRMGYTRCDTWAEYLEYVRRDKSEADTLVRDLLINVTQFFRDPAAWRFLQEEAIPGLLEQLKPKETLRAWVPACASGEEAYSLAIAITEAIEALNVDAQFQIFATDLRPESLERARSGTYPSSIAADISGPRLDRHFTREGNTYRINKSIRDRVIFASHDILNDPPFGNLDLVSCRNLLIYLRPEGQRRLLQLLRFSLRAMGVLFLGKAESVGDLSGHFTVLSKKWRIYRHRETKGLQELHVVTPRRMAAQSTFPSLEERTPEDMLRKQLLDVYAPPSVVVDEQLQIKYMHGPVNVYLSQASGAPTNDLAKLCPAGLRTRLWAALRKVTETQSGVLLENIEINLGTERLAFNIQVQALNPRTPGQKMFLVGFHAAQQAAAAAPLETVSDNALVHELEHELQLTRAQLQGMIHELERSNEALRASNEEIMSMNEELQTANEELETSREELQSLNEELRAVNGLLEDKVEVAEEARNDVENLLSSINIPTLFLDGQLRIKRFTPATTGLLSLIPSDVGRVVSDFAHKFIDPAFLADVQRVLDDAQASEQAIQTNDGRIFMRRIHPYLTRTGAMDGLVITFWDVTDLRRTQDALRLNEERFRTALRDSPVVVYQQDHDLRYTWVYNPQASLSEADYLGKTAAEVYDDPGTVARLDTIKRRVLASGKGERIETQIVVKNKVHHFDLVLEPSRDEEGKVCGLIAAATDITERVNTERDRRRLAAIVESSTDAIIAKTLDGVITNWNCGAETLYGYTADEIIGLSIATLAPPGYEHEIAQLLKSIRAKQRVDSIETVRRRKDGSLVDVSVTISPIVDGAGAVIGASVIARDITARKTAEKQLRELNENLERRIAERTRSMLQYQEQLRVLASQLTLAEQQERRRLSTELHDFLAQELVVCQMRLARVRKAMGTERAIELIGDIDEMLAGCLQYTRTLVAELSPSVLFEMGLTPALQWLGNQMATHGLQVSVVQECPQPHFTDDEAILLFKTVRELLFNVVKHARTETASVVLSRDNADFIVKVVDDGAGFDPTQLGRHPTSAGKYGLFSLRERLDVMGGRFEIDAAPGHGSRITLVVPYRTKDENTPSLSSAFQPGPTRTTLVRSGDNKLRLVIADDHRLVREGIRNLFGSFEDIEVVAEAENGEQALQLARQHMPDVVVMDVNMPRMNGIEATRILKRELPAIAVVGLSVYDDKEIAASMLDAGACCYVTKGSPADELYAAVQTAADRAS